MQMNDRDPHTGHRTTGHDWNGIRELNTPVPKAVWFFLILTVLFSVAYWVLMPAFPLGKTYTKGVLGADQKNRVEAEIAAVQQAQQPWMSRIEQDGFDVLLADKEIMERVRTGGKALFADNCATCHGAGGKGQPGFPNLTDSHWLWGGSPEAIAETLRVGINSSHPDTRISQMMAFGRDQLLSRSQIEDVVSYIDSLRAGAEVQKGHETAIAQGAEIFQKECVACHGTDAKGLQEMGAPDLTGDGWIYGGDRQTLLRTIWHGRIGEMPTWESRLTLAQRRMLTLYVIDLAEQEKP